MSYQESLLLELRRRELLKELQKRSLYEFFKGAWQVLEPGRPLALNWHQQAICEYLMCVSTGEIKRLLINIAPRHLKSNICSIAFPCWEWLQAPWLRYLCLSYSGRLSNKLNLKRRLLIQSDWYQKNFGSAFSLAEDHNLKTEFINNHQGQMFASSFGGTVTGEGGERIIVDDPHNPDETESDVVRESTVSEFDDAVGTRLNDPQTGAVIVVMQRVHDQDVSGHILSEIGGYTHLCLPTECEQQQIIYFPISKTEVVRKPGELLHPERFGRQETEEAKVTLGSYKYSARHQQNPAPLKGGMIEARWLKRYEVTPCFENVIQSWDTAQKASELNSPWSCTTWGIAQGKFYLIHVFTKRMEYPEGRKTVSDLIIRFRPNTVLIEDKSTGSSLIQELRMQGVIQDEYGNSHFTNVIAITPEGDKISRMSIESTAFESGRVWFPTYADWLPDYEMALTRFPKGLLDPVDATSQFLKWARRRGFVSTNFVAVQPHQIEPSEDEQFRRLASRSPFGSTSTLISELEKLFPTF